MFPPSQNDFDGTHSFVTTHWTAIINAASDDPLLAEQALVELCQTYWYPVFVFIRRQVKNPHDAEDFTQEFFARLIQKDYVASARREQGKFRTFLMMAVKRFLANEYDRATAQKRGGGQVIISMDGDSAEARYQLEPAHHLTLERLFEQRWAMALLDQVLARLASEYVEPESRRQFEMLRGALLKEPDSQPYAELAAQLGLTEAAVKMAVRRLRERYRDILREEIGKTVSCPAEIEDEIRHLFATFAS